MVACGACAQQRQVLLRHWQSLRGWLPQSAGSAPGTLPAAAESDVMTGMKMPPALHCTNCSRLLQLCRCHNRSPACTISVPGGGRGHGGRHESLGRCQPQAEPQAALAHARHEDVGHSFAQARLLKALHAGAVVTVGFIVAQD
jgi:hypothetical protein